MRNILYRLLFTAIFTLFGLISTNAQVARQVLYVEKPMLINWMPDSLSTPRYTIAVSPWVLMFNNGLKLDFEIELPRKGRWVQFSAMGYYAHERSSDDFDVWNSFSSCFDDFYALKGAGLAVFYKQMFTPRGWYYNVGVLMNYFDVGNHATRFVSSVEDGMTFWRPKTAMFYTKYYKPMLQVNVGKHIPLSNRLFIDFSTGLGYAHSFYNKDKHNGNYDNMYGFAYRGLEWNFGFRLGVLLGKSGGHKGSITNRVIPSGNGVK